MLFYNYSRETFEYIGEPEEARLDPVEQQPMIPAFATTIAPPSVEANKIAIFDSEAGKWSVVSDFRGTVYYKDNGASDIITNTGAVIPDGCSTIAPPAKVWFYTISDNQWIPKPIDTIKEMKISEAYSVAANVMSTLLNKYSAGERETWSKMNDECIEYKSSGTVGSLMLKKISTSPIYNTADKLVDMTITEYQLFIDKKFSIEAQRDHHKINIESVTDVDALINYDVSVSL